MKILMRFCMLFMLLNLLCLFPTRTMAAPLRIGVVVLHGKWGNPNQHISSFASGLRDAGLVVITPEMPWSGARLYDKGIDGAMDEIDAAVATLKKQGATTIVIAGHSLGAMAALHYGGSRQIDGLIMLAPGHSPESKRFRQKTASDVAQAQEYIAHGTPEALVRFSDMNTGTRFKDTTTTARIYLDYFDPNGPMNSQRNARSLPPGIPVLWIVGSHEESGLRMSGEKVRDSFSPKTALTLVTIDADHLQTPYYAVTPTINWIRSVLAGPP